MDRKKPAEISSKAMNLIFTGAISVFGAVGSIFGAISIFAPVGSIFSGDAIGLFAGCVIGGLWGAALGVYGYGLASKGQPLSDQQCDDWSLFQFVGALAVMTFISLLRGDLISAALWIVAGGGLLFLSSMVPRHQEI